MTEDSTLIRIKLSTKAKLDKIGSKGDSYDDIITRMLDRAEGKKK